MSTPNQDQSSPSNNQNVSEFSLELNQTFSGSLFSSRRPSSRFIGSPSKPARNNKAGESCLSKVRSLISQNLLEEAIKEVDVFFKPDKIQKFSMSPSKIISPQKQDLQTTLNMHFCHVACLMALKRYIQSLEVLQKIRQKDQHFKKNTIYFLSAICYEQVKQYSKALSQINQVLTSSEKSIDHMFLKGKILKNMGKLTVAGQIFQEILKNVSDHDQSLKMIIELHILQKQEDKALEMINKGIQKFPFNTTLQRYLLMRKVQIQYKLSQYNESMNLIIQLEQRFKLRQSKLNYLKGKISLKLKKYQDSIIYFNQALEVHSSNIFVRQSLAELIIYFLRQRDFYEASLYCKRAGHLLNEKSQLIQSLSFLAEGLILLMKRNFEEGLKTISMVGLNKFQEVKEKNDIIFLNNLFFNAQGFAFFSLGNHNEALQCYIKMNVSESEQEYLPCFYNIKLVEGILSILSQQNQQKAIQCFEKAIDYLLRPEPYFYISVILTQKNMKYEASAQIFMKILSILQSGLNVNQTAEMHFYRSLVFMYLGMNVEAIEDLDKAIEVSQDNVIQHFYAKGLIYFIQQNYDQAIAEFEVTLSIDQKYARAMLEKAKCEILQGNSEQAYLDLETYRQLETQGIDTTVWELYFLLQQRKFEQILQLDFNNYNENSSNEVKNSIEDIKNTCNFFIGRFQDSGASGKLIMALIYETFEQLLKLLEQALELKVNVGPISELDLKFIKAYVLFRMEKFEDAISTFEQIQRILSLNEKDMLSQDLELRFLITRINTIFCYYASKDVEICREKLIILINEINESEVSEQLRNILAKIQQEQTSKVQNQQESIQPNNQNFHIVELLSDKELLSSFLPLQRIGSLSFKLIVPFPILDVAQLKPNRQKMLEQYEFKRIENRPEAPWIKRGLYGVLFTNEIRQYNNLHLNTEETQPNSKQKLIDDLRLGSQVLLKLQKIQQIQ